LVLELGPLQPLFQNGRGLSTELEVLAYDRYLPRGQETRAAEAAIIWNVYEIASKGVWLGEVEAR
jgi:hypothetical protein